MRFPHLSSLIPNFLLAERDRLILWFPVLVGLGISLFFARHAPTSLTISLATLAACTVGLFLARKHLLASMVMVACFAVALGFFAASLRMIVVAAPVLSEPVFFKTITGTISDIQERDKKMKLIINHPHIETLSQSNTPRRLSITIKAYPHSLRVGDQIRIPATLFPPPAPAMPGAFDFARMFYFDQLGAVGASPRQPEILSRAASNRLEDKLTTLRLSIADHLQAHMGEQEGPVASAMIVGEQSRVSEEVSDSMRASGIYHILSISGLHMTLATGLFYYTIRLLLAMIPGVHLRFPIKKIAAATGLAGGFLYLLLSGYPVPAVRSYIMVACVLVAVLCDRKGISLFSLGWAATLILLVLPESLLTASFQLTFAATLAIVALYERFGHVLFHSNAGPVHRVRLFFLGLMLTSLAATFFTTPLAIYHFNRMSNWGIISNMLMVPLASFVIMPSALLSLLLMPVGLETPALWVLNLAIRWMIEGSHWVASLPYAQITLPAPTNAGFIGMIVGGLWLGLWRSTIRWGGIVLIIIGVSTIATFKPYDVIISDDAKRIAYRMKDGAYAFIRGDVDSFESEIWLRMNGAEVGRSRKEALVEDKNLRCDKSSCMLELNGKTITARLRKDNNLPLCESGADIIITDQRLQCDDTVHVIDREFVERYGAVAIYVQSDAISLQTSQEQRGFWPWNISYMNTENNSDEPVQE